MTGYGEKNWYCAEVVDGNNGIGAEAAQAASARSAQPCITQRKRPKGAQRWDSPTHDFAPGGRNNPRPSARRHCGVWRPPGADAEKHPFRPRRALRALADGYANGALRALAAYAAFKNTHLWVTELMSFYWRK